MRATQEKRFECHEVILKPHLDARSQQARERGARSTSTSKRVPQKSSNLVSN